jgi:hypothetical protein
MGLVHIDLTLDESVARQLQERAARQRVPADRYVADLIAQDARREQDTLAEEGYRLLSQNTAEVAEAAWLLSQSTWPEWNACEPNAQTKWG